MTIPRSLQLLTVCLGLTSACASRAPLPGPDPATVRTIIAAQIAQSARAIPDEDTMVTSLRRPLLIRRTTR